MNTSTTALRSSVSFLGKSLLVLAPFLASATLSHAALLLQENFNSSGPLNGQNGWTANANLNVVAGGLSYNNDSISISGGAYRAQSNVVVDAATPLAVNSFASQSGEVWFSFTMQVVGTPNTASRYWFWVSDTTSINTGMTGAVGATVAGNNTIYSEIRTISTSTNQASSHNVAGGQTYFLVGRLSKEGPAIDSNVYDRMELWVNPTSTTLSDPTVSNRAGSAVTGGITYFGLTGVATAADLAWDNLRVGTTQADVLDVYAIPEPSTYAALVGLAALGLVTLRRRRA